MTDPYTDLDGDREAQRRVAADSDAPTPREATPVDGLREALQDLPFSRQWPTQKPPGEWYVRVEDAISFMVEERAREAQAGSRSARSSTALQAAASTAAAGEGATGGDLLANWLDSILLRYVNRPFGQAEAIGCRDAVFAELAALRSSPATSETPRETPLAAAAWDTALTDAEEARLADAIARADHANWTSRELAARIAGTVRAIAAGRLVAARGSE